MSWTPNEKEIRSVISLPSPKRYEYFIKKAADEEQLWSLWQEGWCLARDDSGRDLVPVWPHSTFAKLCATGDWAYYAPKKIDLSAWFERWIPGMEKDNRRVAVFPTPLDNAVVVEPRRIEADLRNELLRYE